MHCMNDVKFVREHHKCGNFNTKVYEQNEVTTNSSDMSEP